MDSTSTEMNMSVLTDCRAHWEKPVIFNPTWKVCHDSDTSQVMVSCSFFLSFFLRCSREAQACTGSRGVDYLATPWPRSTRKHHCVSSLCGFARQAGSWHGPENSTVRFLWLAWMVHWWKMEITSDPAVPFRFCCWSPDLLKINK